MQTILSIDTRCAILAREALYIAPLARRAHSHDWWAIRNRIAMLADRIIALRTEQARNGAASVEVQS